MIGSGIGPTWPGQVSSGLFVRQPFVVGVFGQSQPNYMMAQGSYFRQIANPVPGNGNLIAYTQSLPAGIVKTTVDAASVAAGQVNPVLAAWSAFFARTLPGREIVVVDLCEGGTGRNQLMNNANTGRNWSDFEAMVTRVRQDYDDIDLIVECWMANDNATAKTMPAEWSPLYMGQRWGGEAFTLGTANPDSVRNPGVTVDHCLWDIEAGPDNFGRGLFRRARTKWSVVGWPTFNSRDDADPEMAHFTDAPGYPTTVDKGARDSLSEMFSDPRYQSFARYDGFSSHIARMTDGGSTAATHPSVLTPDGQVLMGWPYAASILQGTGHAIAEPSIVDSAGPETGAYLDLVVDLPNGGSLSTLRALRARINKTPERDDVEALWSDPARTGCRLPVAALKVPGVDALPDGVIWDVGNKRVIVPSAVTVPAFEGWNFSDCYLEIRGTVSNGFIDCLLTSRTTQSTTTILDIYASAVIGEIAHCSFRGESYRNRALATLITVRFEEIVPDTQWETASIEAIHHCSFTGFPTDCIKSAHAGEIHSNYFDVPRSMKFAPQAYDAGTAYDALDPVIYNGLEYISLSDGNTDNTPSGDTSDTAFWAYADPHSDIVNPRAVIGGSLEIWGNFINMAHSIRRMEGDGEPWGMTNGIRMNRDGPDIVTHGEVNAHHNIIATDGPDTVIFGHQVVYPISLGLYGDANWTPNRLENNWITPGNNDRYTYEVDPLPNVVANNSDYDPATAVAPAAPHQQQVTGFEITRAGGARRPIYRADQTGYPASHRGSAVIVDTGSGTPRQGRVRITPELPFGFGDGAEYLRGDAGAILLEPRDADANLWADMLIEHVPALYDPAATYPMEGVAVRPQPDPLLSGVLAPTFIPQGATFDGVSHLQNKPVSVPATNQGVLSFWFRNASPTWAQLKQIMEMRVGTTDVFNLRTNSSGRIRLDVGASVVSFFAGPTSATPFVVDQWYHILIAWDDTALTVHVNDTLATSSTITPVDMAGQTLTQVSVADRLTEGQAITGDLAHFYLNLSAALDMSVAANRAKFASGGSPVDLGSDGVLPTGTAPEFYLDGVAPAWANQGSGPSLDVTGVLTASAVPGY